jgi:hypothetical protein
MEWPGINDVREAILRRRNRLNQNNLTRTNYYYRYWKAHPEVPWALMANLVSRNAGYSMTDLERYYKLAMGGASPLIILPTFDPVLLFMLLEAGNFLIFRDVCPALEAYDWSKRFPFHTTEIFNLLMDPEFDADPFIVSEWVNFTAQAMDAGWLPDWTTDERQRAIVRRHTFALVVNEQNQIEDRLVNPPLISRYLPIVSARVSELVLLANVLGLTRLCFVLGPSTAAPQTSLLLYQVQNFLSLENRINTGRDMFVGLFEQGAARRLRIEGWANRHPGHTGSRTDYNRSNYSTDLSALSWPGPIFYSPWLTQGWPVAPGRTLLYRHLHQQPEPLPVPVAERPNYRRWLEPPLAPKPMREAQLADLEEIVDDNPAKLPAWLFNRIREIIPAF